MWKNSIIWAVSLAIALASGLTAMGAIAKKKEPELVINLEPLNGFALESSAFSSIKGKIASSKGLPSGEMNPVTLNWAKKAFAREPTATTAIAIIGLDRENENYRKLQDAALRLSRRDKLVNATMITRSANDNDLEALLAAYDTSMRSSYSSASTLNLNLALALQNKGAVDPLASLLKKNPPWARSFWDVVVKDRNALENATRLRTRLSKNKLNQNAFNDEQLLYYLVGYRKYDHAKALLDHIAPKQKGMNELVENGSFKRSPIHAPFDWELLSGANYIAEIDTKQGELYFDIVGSRKHILTRQLISPEKGHFSITLSMRTDPSKGQVEVQLRCADIGGEKIPQKFIKIGRSDEKYPFEISDTACRFYWLNLVGEAIANENGFSGGISSVSIQETE